MYFSDAFDFSVPSSMHCFCCPWTHAETGYFILPLLWVLSACPLVPLLLSSASGLPEQAPSLKLLLGKLGRENQGDPLKGLWEAHGRNPVSVAMVQCVLASPAGKSSSVYSTVSVRWYSFWSTDSGCSMCPPPVWAHAPAASLRCSTERACSVGWEGLWADKELGGVVGKDPWAQRTEL